MACDEKRNASVRRDHYDFFSDPTRFAVSDERALPCDVDHSFSEQHLPSRA
jgi:hypothetical protein